MKKTVLRAGIVGLAGSVGAGLLAISGTANADSDDAALRAQRDDLAQEWVVADDDDDGDADAVDQTRTRTRGGTQTRTRGGTQTRSGVSGPETRTAGTGTGTFDATGSRVTDVSRDRDRSRGDQTRDWTRDGGDRTRDFSRNLTDDRSRNDTRRGR